MNTPAAVPAIEFSVQLTEKEVAKANDEVTSGWSRCLFPAIALSVAGIVGFLLPANWPAVATAVTAGGVLLVYTGTVVPLVLRTYCVRQFRRNPATQAKLQFKVYDDRVAVASELAESEMRWTAFVKAKQTRGYLFLYLAPSLVHVVPFAQLTPEHALHLREIVTMHLPATAHKRWPFSRP